MISRTSGIIFNIGESKANNNKLFPKCELFKFDRIQLLYNY